MTVDLWVAWSCLVAPSGVESRPCCLELVMLVVVDVILGVLLRELMVFVTAALLVLVVGLVVGVGDSLTSYVVSLGALEPPAAGVKLSLSGGSGAPDARDLLVGGGRNALLVGVGVVDVAGGGDMSVGLGEGFIIRGVGLEVVGKRGVLCLGMCCLDAWWEGVDECLGVVCDEGACAIGVGRIECLWLEGVECLMGVTLELDCVGGDSVMMGGRDLCLLWFGVGSDGLACEVLCAGGCVLVDVPGLMLVDGDGDGAGAGWIVRSLMSVFRNTTGRLLASMGGGRGESGFSGFSVMVMISPHSLLMSSISSAQS